MSEKLKELLEKINEEGVKQAEEKARSIESKATSDAKKILEDAKTKAQKIVEEAESEGKKIRETGELALKQASRDLILSLKDEIKKIFNKIIATETSNVMSDKEISAILGVMIQKYVEKNGESSDIKVLLNKEDLEKLKNTFIAKLKQKFKDGIEFKPSPNIETGFSISFDKGKSYFDFSDEALLETFCTYLNPELARLLKG